MLSTSTPMPTLLQANTTSHPAPTRRAFLRQGTLACLAAGAISQAAPLAWAATPAQAKGGPFAVPAEARVKRLLRSTFAPHLSEHFETANDSGEPVVLLLLEINDLPAQQKQFAAGGLAEAEIKQSREESFALTLRGPRDWPLRQRIYQLAHPKLGKLELFLVPVGKVGADDVWRMYEAVFNRLER